MQYMLFNKMKITLSILVTILVNITLVFPQVSSYYKVDNIDTLDNAYLIEISMQQENGSKELFVIISLKDNYNASKDTSMQISIDGSYLFNSMETIDYELDATYYFRLPVWTTTINGINIKFPYTEQLQNRRFVTTNCLKGLHYICPK